MYWRTFTAVVGILVLAWSVPVSAADTVKAQQAQKLVENAIEMFKAQGREITLQAINDKNGPFVKGELYIFALTMDNKMLGHPHEHSIRRINVSNVQDNKGVKIFQRFKEVVTKNGSGWVEYLWAKPGQEVPSAKRSFVKKVPGEDLYIGAGYYLQ